MWIGLAVFLLHVGSVATQQQEECLSAYCLDQAAQAQGTVSMYVEGSTTPTRLLSYTMDRYRLTVAPYLQLTFVSSGSGGAKSALIAKREDWGSTETTFTDAEFAANPDMMMVPTVAYPVLPVINLPTITGSNLPRLCLTLQLFLQIYMKNITNWRDPQILAINPDIKDLLPNLTITTLGRADGNGLTNVVTKAFSTISTTWKTQFGSGNSIAAWPNGTRMTNTIRVHLATLAAVKGSIGYSALPEALATNVQLVDLMTGKTRVAANAESVGKALAVGPPFDSRNRATLGVPDSTVEGLWPMAMYSYVIIRTNTSLLHNASGSMPVEDLNPGSLRSPTCLARREIVKWFRWLLLNSASRALMADLGYVPLYPSHAQYFVDMLGATIWCGNQLALPAVRPTVVITSPRSLETLVYRYIFAFGLANLDAVSPYADFHTDSEDALGVCLGQWNGTLDASTMDQSSLCIYEDFRISSIAHANLAAMHGYLVTQPLYSLGWVPYFNVPILLAQSSPPVFPIEILSLIYQRNITRWNDTRLVAISPSLVNYTNQIILIVANVSTEDGSISTLMSQQSDSWRQNIGFQNSLGSFFASNYSSITTGSAFADLTASSRPVRVAQLSAQIIPLVNLIPGTIAIVRWSGDLDVTATAGISAPTTAASAVSQPISVSRLLSCQTKTTNETDKGLCWPLTSTFNLAYPNNFEGDKLCGLGLTSLAVAEYLLLTDMKLDPLRWAVRPAALSRPSLLQVRCDGNSYRDNEVIQVVDSSLVSVLIASLSIALGFGTLCMFVTVWKRKHPIIKTASWPFLVLIALGAMLEGLVPLFFLVGDVTQRGQASGASCSVGVWVGVLGMVLYLSAIFAKTWRLSRIFAQPNQGLKVIRLPNHYLFRLVFLCITIAVFLLALLQGLGPLQAVRTRFVDSAPVLSNEGGLVLHSSTVRLFNFCQSETPATLYPPLAFVFLLVLITAYVPSGRIPGKFNEAVFIGYLVSAKLVSGLFVVLLIWTSTDPSLQLSILLVTLPLDALFTLLLVFGHKLWPMFCKKGKIQVSGDSGGDTSGNYTANGDNTSKYDVAKHTSSKEAGGGGKSSKYDTTKQQAFSPSSGERAFGGLTPLRKDIGGMSFRMPTPPSARLKNKETSSDGDTARETTSLTGATLKNNLTSESVTNFVED